MQICTQKRIKKALLDKKRSNMLNGNFYRNCRSRFGNIPNRMITAAPTTSTLLKPVVIGSEVSASPVLKYMAMITRK